MTNFILVVEDNEDIQVLFRLVLESEGYKVAMADNGKDALKLLEEIQPQLVLMDIMMPGISGIDVSHSIKQQPNYETLPILLVSAVDRLKEQQLNYSKADGIIYKPFNLDELLHKVDQLTSGREVWTDADADALANPLGPANPLGESDRQLQPSCAGVLPSKGVSDSRTNTYRKP